MIVDNLARRGYDAQLGMDTLTPITSIHERIKAWQEVSGKTVKLEIGDVCDWEFLSQVQFISICLPCCSALETGAVSRLRPTIAYPPRRPESCFVYRRSTLPTISCM
jgi:hypothetical protein